MSLKFNAEKLGLLNAFFRFDRPVRAFDHAFHRTDEETAGTRAIIIDDRMGVDVCQIRKEFCNVRRRENDAEAFVAVGIFEKFHVQIAEYVPVFVVFDEGSDLGIDELNDLFQLICLSHQTRLGWQKTKLLL